MHRALQALTASLAASLLLVPSTAATSNSYSDPAGDGGLLGPAYDILDWTVSSNGTAITTTLTLDDLTAGQDGVRYNMHLASGSGQDFTASCVVGAGIPVLAPSGCSADIVSATLLGQVVLSSSAVPVTSSVDYAADTVSVSFAYGDVGASSGDSWTVELAASQLPPFVFVQGVTGDAISVGSTVTLA